MRYKKYIQANEEEPIDNSTAKVILQAATELFMRQGYHSVTMRDIASHANVNLGLLPYHFTSKENLAKHVYLGLMDRIYRQIGTIDMSRVSNAEKIYITTLLSWKYVENSEEYSKFFYEFYESAGPFETPSKLFIQMSSTVILEHGLQIGREENELYFTVMKGAEWLLIQKRYKKEIQITLEEMLNILYSNYLYNIGLSDKIIAETIQNSLNFLKSLET
ncbi:TetR/AcrR family transcriptional regulator [Paenibacillus doosanensis]|uniref:DNA-binding transcriptional regulator n=1 Tax=Paenibacillus konkukensis TaxID=2020716 RepID=A0ABY4RKL5_9BACL|nr:MULTISPECIES: TetR/AcrR family transcriptional regulator [Paenibacillus]MCS7464989.1 TetR/AcrR family transcriptional regulator [Paenibacillus doosanensis]UQZ83019.1 putative DNA-binding transcriptional regulator [Paenibacillus konkukensis]